MQTWSLERYVELHGSKKAAEVWGVERQAVEAAIGSNRTITIKYDNGYYWVEEAKTLKLPTMEKEK